MLMLHSKLELLLNETYKTSRPKLAANFSIFFQDSSRSLIKIEDIKEIFSYESFRKSYRES